MDRVSWLRSRAKGRILDVGSNDGHVFPDWPNVTRLDLDAYPIPRMVRGEAEALPFADRSFDTVVLAEVLEHIPNPYPALREARRVSRARVLLSLPDEHRWAPEHRPLMPLSERLALDHLDLDTLVKHETRTSTMTTDERARPHLYHAWHYDAPLLYRVLAAVFGTFALFPLSYDGWYFLCAEARA